MAYDLSERFKHVKKHRHLDPGAYQYPNPPPIQENKVPFLSKAPRNTQSFHRLWTDVIYYPDYRPKIPNCVSLQSNLPRFVNEKLTNNDFDDVLCDCEENKPCECSVDNEVAKQQICQGKVHRRIFKGPPPRVAFDEGLSSPCKRDHGHNIRSNGSQYRILQNSTNDTPPFYDAGVTEATAFYQGCKWSKWTSKRDMKSKEGGPGPADYFLETKPNRTAICAEKVRAQKRKESRQLRFIEMVQRQNILENRPGPASYNPILSGTKDFHNKVNKNDEKEVVLNIPKWSGPGPTEYSIKRDFDVVSSVLYCHVRLLPAAPFGVKAVRFKTRYEFGPSPASYTVNLNICRIQTCTNAPFSTSEKRFKDKINENDVESYKEEVESLKEQNKNYRFKYNATWPFRSKTIRMKSSIIKAPSPADMPLSKPKARRSIKLQNISPFHSSQGRFRNWYNWIAVYGKDQLPGPGYYCLEKPICNPALARGPLCRTRRFVSHVYETPAPNEYKISTSIDDTLKTHNVRLKTNIDKQHKFIWEPPPQPDVLTLDQKEEKLLNDSIAILNTAEAIFGNTMTKNNKKNDCSLQGINGNNNKILKCFNHIKHIPIYF